MAKALIVLMAVVTALFWAYLQSRGLAREMTSLKQLDHPYYFNIVYMVFGMVGLGIGAGMVKRRFGGSSAVGKALLLLSIGPLIWLPGNLVWFYYNSCTHWSVLTCGSATAAPYPSLADVFYVLFFPVVLTGFWLLGRSVGIRRRQYLTGSWTAVLALLLAGHLQLAPIDLGVVTYGMRESQPDQGTLRSILEAAYPLMDVGVVYLSAVLVMNARRFAGGAFLGPLRMLALSGVAYYVADTMIGYELAKGTYLVGNATDAMYAISMIIWSVGVVRFGSIDAVQLQTLVERPNLSRDERCVIAIIETQHRMLGQSAYSIARRVEGLQISDGAPPRMIGNAANIVEDLCDRYGAVSGPIGRQACDLAIAAVERTEMRQLPMAATALT